MTKKETKLEATQTVAPSKVGFWDTTVGKTARAAIYLAISAAIAGILTDIQNNPELFGIYTPFINLALVAIKNLASPTVKNI